MHDKAFRQRQTWCAACWPMVLLSAAWLSGCAQQVKVTSTWQDNVPRNQSFTRVLVVGVSPDINQRCAFEQFLVSQISSQSTTAIASCDAVTKKNPLTRESIELAVASQQADAVVATILVSKTLGEQEGGSRDTRGGAYYKATDVGYATGYYGVYGVPVVYGDFETTPSITTIKGQIHVTTKVYETNGPTLVCTLDTKAKVLESSDVTLSAITSGIADQLRRDKLVR